MKRRAYKLKAGNVKNLKVREEDLADPADNEVTIAIKTIGLNFADLFAIWGLYSATPKGEFVPGLEYAGIVEKIGKNVTNVKEGDQIMGITRFGAYASHLNIDSRYVLPLPASWNFEEGAAYLVQVLTAHYGLLHLGNLQKEQTVLIHSAAGGVGILANRIAKKYDAFTIGTVGSPAKVDFLKKEGYDRTIVRSSNFGNDLKSSLGDRDLNLIMECIGGKVLSEGYKQLAPQGRMIVYGSARYATPGNRPNYFKLIYQFLTRPKIDPQGMTNLNTAVLGFNLIWLYEKAELMHEILKEIEVLQIEKPHIGHRFTFEELPDALKLFQSGKTIGKVVINL